MHEYDDDDRNMTKMQKTKNVIQKVWEEQCIAGIAQQYMDGVAELRQEAIANGRAFPQGLSGWHKMSEAEQQRVTWATRAIEANERLVRSSSAADRMAAVQAAGGSSSSSSNSSSSSQGADIQKRQWQPVPVPVPEIDQALVARFGNGGPYAGVLRTLAAQRDYSLFARRRWPADITGWAEDYSDEERRLILEATRYMEQQEAVANSILHTSPELSDGSSSENEEWCHKAPCSIE